MTTISSPPLTHCPETEFIEAKKAQSFRMPCVVPKGHRPVPEVTGFGRDLSGISTPASPGHPGKYLPFSTILATPQHYKGNQRDVLFSPGRVLRCPETPSRSTPRRNGHSGQVSPEFESVKREIKMYFGTIDPKNISTMKMIGEGNFSYVYEVLDAPSRHIYGLKVSKGKTRLGTPEKKEQPEPLKKTLSIRLDMTDDDDDDDDDDEGEGIDKFDALFGPRNSIDDDELFNPELIAKSEDLFRSSRRKTQKSPATSFIRTQSTDSIDDEKGFSYAHSAIPVHTPPQPKKAKTETPFPFSLDDDSLSSSEDIDDRSSVENTRILNPDELGKEACPRLGPIVVGKEALAEEGNVLDSIFSVPSAPTHRRSKTHALILTPHIGLEEPRSDKLPDPIVMVKEAEMQRKFKGVKEIVNVEACWRNPDSRICMLLELCGPSLREILNRMEEPLPIDLYLSYFKDMARALCALREKGVLHMDIKPDNIFMAPTSDWGEGDLHNASAIATKFPHVKLGDFGVALDQEALKEVYLPDGDGKYASKEAMVGRPSFACDMFSLGITMYELAIPSLVLPLNGDLWEALRNDDVDTSKWPYSEQLLEVIKRMLSSIPTNRPTPTELCELLAQM